MKFTFTFIFVVLLANANIKMSVQAVGKIETKDDSFKISKLSEGSKELYLAGFTIIFETYKEAVDKKEAGGFGRSVEKCCNGEGCCRFGHIRPNIYSRKGKSIIQ